MIDDDVPDFYKFNLSLIWTLAIPQFKNTYLIWALILFWAFAINQFRDTYLIWFEF